MFNSFSCTGLCTAVYRRDVLVLFLFLWVFFFFWKEGCWGEKLAVGVHRKREILLVTTFLCRDSVLTAFCVVSLPISKLWDIVYFDDIFILLVLVLVWGYSVCNQKVLLKLMEQRIYFYELIQFFPNNWKQDVLY